MKFLQYILFASMLLLLSCNKSIMEGEEYVLEELYEKTISFDIESSSRATYGNDNKFFMESGDCIDVVQGTDGSPVFAISNTMENPNEFHGLIYMAKKDTEAFHFAYPSGSLTNNKGNVSYSFTIPSSQYGKWVPYLYATKDLDFDKLENVDLHFGSTMAGCIAIRIYNNSKEIGKNDISKISISAENAITGSITNGVVSGTGTQITLPSNPSYITGENSGGVTYYEYRFNAIPGTCGKITINITDSKKSEKVTTSNAITVKANYRHIIDVIWTADERQAIATAEFSNGDTCQEWDLY